MPKTKPRYLIVKPGREGKPRFYWQPTARMRARGWENQRLDDDEETAFAQARALNAKMDGRVGRALRAPAPRRRPIGMPGEKRIQFEHKMIYVIGPRTGPYKIGISATPFNRLADLQSANARTLRLWLLMDCYPASAAAVEKAAHARLDSGRRRGEWFDVPVAKAIMTITEAHKMLMRASHELSDCTVRPV